MTRQSSQSRLILFLLGMAGLVVAGCSSVDPNPPDAAANTGYVDFYCETATNLSWDVYRVDAKGKSKTLFSQYKPLEGNVLRIASTPGEQRFRVAIFNRVTEGPDEATVLVEQGKVTPVKVKLVKSGAVTTQDKSYSFRGSAKGYARGTKFSQEENPVLDLLLEPQPAVPYEPKEKMAYRR